MEYSKRVELCNSCILLSVYIDNDNNGDGGGGNGDGVRLVISFSVFHSLCRNAHELWYNTNYFHCFH